MRMERTEVLQQALALQTPLVELTGGEPLLQPGALPLLSELCDAGKVVLLETSGERDISGVDPRVHRIVDLKAPESGESHRNRWENIQYLTPNDEIKIVVTSRSDYDWAKQVIVERQLAERVRAVLLSCAFDTVEPKEVVRWMVEDKLPARFQIQMHKVIWSKDAQGV